MRKSVKVVCASVLCAVMAFTGTVPFKNITTKPKTTVSAEGEYDGEFTYQKRTFRYRNNGSSEITLVKVLDQGGDLSIPSTVTINGTKKTVTKLVYPFGGWQTYNKITVPDTVKKIDGHVFYSTTVSDLKLSSNLEEIGECFCMYAKVDSISCSSKKLNLTDNGLFYGATCPNKIILGDWLVKWELDKSETVLDLSTSEMQSVKHVVRNWVIKFDENIKTVKLGKSEFLLNINYYSNYCFRNIENVYVNGKLVKCTSATDTLPKMISSHMDYFDRGNFSLKYASQKAEYVLKDLGLTYYGPNNNMKGKLTANTEYNVCKKVHDYIVKNYVYKSPLGSYLWVFNNHSTSICETDCQMYAFLVECAGVDAETCYQAGGNHAWNVVNIGGDLYYIDTTNDRCNSMYQLFLYSNETSDKGTDLWGGNHINTNQTYSSYGTDKWSMVTYPFANRTLNGKRPNCNKIHGDLDGDYYCRQNDSLLLAAFNCVGDTIKKKCLNSSNGYVSLTDKEYQTINACVTSGGKTIKLAEKQDNGKIKLLFNPKATDVNFDGVVNIIDVVVINQRIGNPFTR